MTPAGPESASRFVRGFDGLRLHVRDYPGPTGAATILCLPGLTRNGRDFAALAGRLAERFRILCPDFRGRGLSESAPDPALYVPASYVGDLAAIFDALAVERAILIGTSLGGLVATLFAALSPERVAGLVLNDVGPEIDPAGLARIASYVGRTPPIVTWDDAADTIALLDEAVYPGFGRADWLRLARQRYTDASGVVRLDYDPAIAQAFALPETTPDAWPFFRELRPLPTLLLRGALSDILAHETVVKMRAALPKLRVVEIADRGHVPTLDEPEAIAAIEGFLAALPSPGPLRRLSARWRGRRFRRRLARAGNPLAHAADRRRS